MDQELQHWSFQIRKIEDVMKIVKSLEESGLLKKGFSETFKMKQKSKKEDFSECY